MTTKKQRREESSITQYTYTDSFGDEVMKWEDVKKAISQTRKDVLKEVDVLGMNAMKKYANSPLKDRQNAFDAIFDLRNEIYALNEK